MIEPCPQRPGLSDPLELELQTVVVYPTCMLKKARQWWRMPLILALGRQRQSDFCVQDQPGLHSEYQNSQGYTEKPCLEKQ